MKTEIVELPTEKVALFEAAYALAASPDHKLSEVREEILQDIFRENSAVKAQIEKFRRENQ